MSWLSATLGVLPVMALLASAWALSSTVSDDLEGLFKSTGIHGRGDEATAGLRAPPQLPPLWNATASSIIKDAQTLIGNFVDFLDTVTSTTTLANATFANVMLPLAQQEAAWDLSYNTLRFFQFYSADAALRKASIEADGLLQKFAVERNSREDMFRLVDHVYQNLNTSEKDLDAESQRVVLKTRQAQVSNGMALPDDAQRNKYKALRANISDLTIRFGANSMEEMEGVWFTPEELAGVPDSTIRALEKGTGQNQGKLRIKLLQADADAASRFATNSTTRQRLYIATDNGWLKNVPVLKDIVVLRDEAARMLGFPNHAAFKLQDSISHDVFTVNSFLSDVRSSLAVRVSKAGEVSRLLEYKKADFQSRNLTFDNNLYYWDRAFYERLMIEKEYNVDRLRIAEYFSAPRVLHAMLHVYEDLFGFVFVELTPEDRDRLSPSGNGRDLAWHDDVVLFAVWDADYNNATASSSDPDAPFLGYLYVDLYTRPNKSGTATVPLQPGFVKRDGVSRHHPVAALIYSLEKPTSARASLVAHSDVVTLFHELGHAMHALSARSRYSRFQAAAAPMEFAEALSQMLENWCWVPALLRRLSAHYQAGEPIPDELIRSMLAAKNVGKGLTYLRWAAFAIFDMAIHTPATHRDAERMDLGVMFTSAMHDVMGLKGPEDLGMPGTWGQGQAHFSHIVGSYDAGYYSYLWSRAYSSDMFNTAFKANPMDPVVCRRYRHTVLERGGSQDELLSLEQFLGRKPKLDAFLTELDSE